MAKRVIKTSRRRAATSPAKDFSFTREAIPVSANGASFLNAYRQQAWEQYESLPLPHTKMEAWRRTDIRRLTVDSFKLPTPDAYADLPPVPEALRQPLVGDSVGGQVILAPGGVLQADLNPELSQRGVIFTDFATAAKKHPDTLEKILGQLVRTEEGKFAALTGALAQSGVVVYVPKGVRVEEPLHSLCWGPGVGLAHFSHLLVWLEEGAELTYLHESASPNETGGQTMHAGIVEIHVGQGANLRFVELQSWGDQVWNFTHERARVERDGNLDWIIGSLGSRLTKTFSDLDLVGEGASGRMSGFYFTDKSQHMDHDTQQNHLAPHTTSDLLFKGALEENSRSVWQGMIYVAPGAQKTDGYQANRNLVLNPKARADSIPGLEILADDVRCTHGSTVGKLEEEQIFYLLSRGIHRKDAERLIVEGFFDPIMQRIPYEGVRSRFQQAIIDKMN